MEKLEATERKRGVCYLSRIPPHMKPLRLRQMLSQYADVLRVYMAPEDASVRNRRKLAGGNRGKNFTEGWVEFAKKKEAKNVAKMLNGQQMGGKRRSKYHFDLWNIKYLHKFKWDNLTEEIAYQNAVRQQKLAAELRAAKRERDFYLSRVDQSKAIEAMESRNLAKEAAASSSGTKEDAETAHSSGRESHAQQLQQQQEKKGQKRKQPTGPLEESHSSVAMAPGEKRSKMIRKFWQREARTDTSASSKRSLLPKSLLSKVFLS